MSNTAFTEVETSTIPMSMHTGDLTVVWAGFELEGKIFHLSVDFVQVLRRLLDQVSDHLHGDFCFIKEKHFKVFVRNVFVSSP